MTLESISCHLIINKKPNIKIINQDKTSTIFLILIIKFSPLYILNYLFYKELEAKMHNANLYFDEGYIFGDDGKGFERINIACPTKTLIEALERLKNEFI